MRHSKHFLSCCLLSLLSVSAMLLSGCSQAFNAESGAVGNGSDLSGKVFGGEVPVTGAHLYLYAATETAYGAASTSLLTSAVTTDPVATGGAKDANGNYYVTTTSAGNWAFTTGDWPCTAGTNIYLLSVGGSQGTTGNNPNGYLMAALGNCSNISSSTSLIINEVTTVASVYALSGFMSSPTQVSSNSTAASIAGLNAAFATAGNLVNISVGAPWMTTPSGTGTVPYQTINTFADILSTCENTTGGVENDGSACGTLFLDTTPSGGVSPTNTVQAALNLVHNPAIDPNGNLYNQIQTAVPFNPYLSATPADWTLPIIFTGGGMSNLYDIAIDGSNNIWAVSDGSEATPPCISSTGSSVFEMSNLGVIKSGSTGYKNSTYLICPFGVTLDTSGNAWVTQDYALKSYLVKITSAGTVSGYTPTTGDADYFNNAAFDASGNLWLSNYLAGYVSRYNVSGNSWAKYSGGGVTAASGGYDESWGVAADGNGQMWFADNDSTGLVSEFDATTGTAGTAVSSSGYSAGGVAYPLRLAVDQGNHIWVANFGASASTSPGTTVSELSNAGAKMGNSPFSLGTLSYGYAPFGIAVDGGNHIWTANASTYGVSELDDSGNVLSPNYGFIGTIASPAAAAMVFPEAVAIDEAGNVWVANYGYTGSPAVAASITELVGAGTPTLTPIEAATVAGTPAAKP